MATYADNTGHGPRETSKEGECARQRFLAQLLAPPEGGADDAFLNEVHADEWRAAERHLHRLLLAYTALERAQQRAFACLAALPAPSKDRFHNRRATARMFPHLGAHGNHWQEEADARRLHIDPATLAGDEA